MKKLIIVLDNIRSTFNVGSIFRTADATGCTKIYLCGITPTPENPKMKKTSLGSENTVDWKYYPNTLTALREIKQNSIPIYGVELTKKSKDFQDFQYFENKTEEIALVFGHEKNGISEPTLDECDNLIYIPMKGSKESLNVAITASILMFEALRYN